MMVKFVPTEIQVIFGGLMIAKLEVSSKIGVLPMFIHLMFGFSERNSPSTMWRSHFGKSTCEENSVSGTSGNISN